MNEQTQSNEVDMSTSLAHVNAETLRVEAYEVRSGFQHVPWRWVRALARASRIDAILSIAEVMRCYFGKTVQHYTDQRLVTLSDDSDFICHRDNIHNTIRMYEEVIFFRNLDTGLIHSSIPESRRFQYVPASSGSVQEHKGTGTAAHYAQQDYGAVSTDDPKGKPGSKKAQRNA